ncbi:TonB-dependent receptor [Ginsengibacter hankyongi]|nr:TonB-dependent receptor [Ginsengibacter hankyongi]
MKKNLFTLFTSFCIPLFCLSQVGSVDSVKSLSEVIVKAYEQNRSLVDVAAPISVTGQAQLNRFGNMSILPALNITPGVSMEERSPGSYRLNIRGSSLRSPFGVRDVKIYLNEIPLTDPSGNTYLNQLSFYNFNSIEIIKGPASSLYGAGIGGAMLIHTLPAKWNKGISLDYTTGSFNTNNINANVKTGNSDYQNNFNYSHQTSNGYRQQAKMHRDIASWESLLRVNNKQTLHAYMSYSDLYYQTPGGLTLAQYNADAKQARPGSGSQPGAVQNKAAIYQKTFLAGFSNEYGFNDHWHNTTSLYGSYTDFTNPGIRVYELRKEPHFGGRSVFEYKKQIGGSSLQLNFGTEAQKGFFNTRDYGNKLGVADSLQSDDNLNIWQYMVFAQADLKLPHGWTVTGGVSLNKLSLQLIHLSSRLSTTQTKVFKNKLPPHIAVLKKINKNVSVYASVARGFSPPTVSEVLRSDGLFGTNLQPEDGIDYEAGIKGTVLHNKLYFDISGFFFDLKNTIVQRIDTNGVYYYVNAGSTKQNGIETYASYQLVDAPHHFINSAKVWSSYAWHDFHYGNFKQVNSDFSKNKLPGAAPNVVVAGLDITSKAGCYINITYNYVDKIALNDANSAYASSYNLLGTRLGYKKDFNRKINAEIFVGADNLFDTKYSLGNDINAAAGRYYNAAPKRNYYAGISFNFNKK